MLVLSRKENQQIVFSELNISIEVLQVRGSQVRLGIVAPKDVRILRGELTRCSACQCQTEQHAIEPSTVVDMAS